MKGLRTVLFACLALVVLLWGLWLALRYATAGQVIFGSFAAAVVAIVVALAGRSSVEALAAGGGISGAAKALLTPAKPEEKP